MTMSRNPSWLVAVLILALAPIGQMAIDIYVTALPTMADSFGVTRSQIQLSTSLYMLAFAGGQILYGPLADAYGRKRVLLGGIGLFFAASLLTVASHHFHAFMAGRLLQGVGITVCSVVMKAIATDQFSRQALAKMSNYMVLVWGLAPVVAPMIGAQLQQGFGWRASLYFLLAYGGALLLLVGLGFRESLQKPVPLRPAVLAANTARILHNRQFQSCCLGMGFCYSILLTFNLCAPFMIQQTLHRTPMFYGRISLLMGGAFFAGVMINRLSWVRQRGPAVCTAAAWLGALSGAVMAVLGWRAGLTVWTLTLPAAAVTFFAGAMFPNLMATGMALFPEFAGLSSSLLGFMLMTFAGLIMLCSSLLSLATLLPIALLFLTVSCGALAAVLRLRSAAQAEPSFQHL